MVKITSLEASFYNDVWEQLGKVTPTIETSDTLPAACYSDQEFFEYERQIIFGNSWVSIGREDQLSMPGDYITLELASVPLIILKNRNGVLRAYANSCRHRGMYLLEGKGCVRAITCPFHGWTYSLDGNLVSAPKIQSLKGPNKSGFDLVSIPITVSDGFVFVSLKNTPPKIEKWLGDFSQKHAPWALDDFVTTHQQEFEVACNWKLFLDVFCEWYHLPYVHSKLVGGHYGPPDPIDTVDGNYTSQFGMIEGRGGLSGELSVNEHDELAFPTISTLKGRDRKGGRYSWGFPNIVFSANPDALWLYEAFPVTVDKTRIVFSFCFPPETTNEVDFENRAKNYYKRLEVAVQEDIVILEKQQKGLSIPYQRTGRYCLELEPMVAKFAHWYAQQLLASQNTKSTS